MAKVSMLEASKLFKVSRPTLLKHLQQGKITGEKVKIDKNEFWKLEVSELARVYERRGRATPESTPKPSPEVTKGFTDPAPELQAEIKLLQAQLEAEKQARALVERHLDDLRKMLPGPEDRPARRRWWPWSGG